MFATLKMVLVYGTLGGLAGVVGIPYSLAVGNMDRLYRVGMWIARAGVRAAGIRVEVRGLEHVPAGVSCIFLSNHVSNLDPPVLLPAVPGKTSVLLKKGLMKIPLLGTAMRMAKFVPVERGSRREAAQESGAAYGGVRGGDAVEGRSAGGVQAGAVLSGDGDGGADCAGGDLGDAEDDAQGELGD
jgi:1-acyl-sn-glycerol-3-phosphate acyltransferase